MEKPNYYAIIPSDVRYDSELKPAAKLLYAEITALANKSGYCTASNQYFADVYQMTDRNIKMLIKQLSDKGYITVVVNKDSGNNRRIYISSSVRRASEENFTPSEKNVPTPSENIFPKPSEKKFPIIIQDSNNTRMNKDMSEAEASNDPSEILNEKFTKVTKADLPEGLQPYFDIACKFQQLFIENLKEDNIPYSTQLNAKLKNVIEPVRLLCEADGFSIDDLRDLYRFIKENKFWRSNVRSTGKMREKAQTLLAQYRADSKSGGKPLSMSELLKIAERR